MRCRAEVTPRACATNRTPVVTPAGVSARALYHSTMTMTMKPQRRAAAKADLADGGAAGEAVDAAGKAAKLMEECGAIKVAWSWFRTAAKVDRSEKQEMADAAGSKIEGFSASKRLMSASHPTVKAANELRNRISGYVRGVSLPVTKLGEETDKKEGGVYLLRKADLADFEQRMTAFQSELRTAEETVNHDLESIKGADKLRMGKLYRAEDYPGSVQLAVNYYPVNLEPPGYLEKFAPKMYRAAQLKAEAWWQGVYENASEEFLEELGAVVKSWAAATGPVVVIYPDETHPLAKYHGAEVRGRIERRDDPDNVPEGKFAVVIRYRLEDDRKATAETTLPAMTEDEYSRLHPRSDGTKARVFRNSTVENLLGMLGKYRRLGSVLSTSGRVSGVVDELEALVRRGGVSADQIGDELRQSRTFRGQVHATVLVASAVIDAAVQTTHKKRRRVDTTLLREGEAAG